MAPGSRHEGLDDFFGAINWRKTISLGKPFPCDYVVQRSSLAPGNQLVRSFKEAVPALADQRKVFEESSATIPEAIRKRWLAMVVAWEADHTCPNPYSEPEFVSTLGDIRLELAQEEAAEMDRGVMSLHELSASVFLSVGLELEDLQRVLRVRAKKSDSKTPAGRLALQEKRNSLQHRIRSWQGVQKIYMPAPATNAANNTPPGSAPTGTQPRRRDEPLYLPSAIPESLWSQGFVSGLGDKYRRLRVAQAEDALHHIRRQIRLRSGLIHYKHIFVDGPGQNSNTRARNQISRLQERIHKYASEYRVARAALPLVWPDGAWRHRLLELKDEHLRPPRDEEKLAANLRTRGELLGDGHREQLWIWRAMPHEARDIPGQPEDISEDEVHEGLRVDWMKARARVRRWDEEIQHLLQEMPRAVRFLHHKAEWWNSQVGRRLDAPADIQDGLDAYAA
ncbi:hypothetical protein FA95DRAFT_1499394 [Auriscalpium vulgare]|uniref:Uncharacterized protein n=1 Tax=Auriscalpium vulgare TaxID=40419 RepID=A0ACB8RFP9_9AGAM|nr:hypothetical protein FA95DRAFT_1499394 [Auriscalpium vulgare]